MLYLMNTFSLFEYEQSVLYLVHRLYWREISYLLIRLVLKHPLQHETTVTCLMLIKKTDKFIEKSKQVLL